ncbi:DUF2779 domain-containing protein [Pseudoduganella sp.]|uniref:DUF2779 domain-containing protein n=1 Tax=Pseudoduganella sp. TaxID=1880898 RepID=UPI0035AFE1D6
MVQLSKSRLLAFRQCQRRLWLELYRPELRHDTPGSQANFAAGHLVGELARRLYDPRGLGHMFDPMRDGVAASLAATQARLPERRPLFEAGFAALGALSYADILLPHGGGQGWRLVEVKSSTEVKDYYLDDVAIQAAIARAAGLQLDGISIAHIDSSWTYPGYGDYRGLLVEQDASHAAQARSGDVAAWIAAAQAIAALPDEPMLRPGRQCTTPWPCGFAAHCAGTEPPTEHPVSWLPRATAKALRACIDGGARDMRDVPDALLNEQQQRVKHATLSGQAYFDAAGAARELAPHPLHAGFLDFETIRFAVPVWAGTRPYQMIPFQFSLHWLDERGEPCLHKEFLDLSGDDPSWAFAQALVAACDRPGPIYAYNAGFERARIKELAERFAALAAPLQAIQARIIDLYPIAQRYYYHPSQQGSWSIKQLLPAIAPDLRYDALEGVQHGGAAMDAYLEACAPGTSPERRATIRRQLLDYCHLDTLAMVRIWKFFKQ